MTTTTTRLTTALDGGKITRRISVRIVTSGHCDRYLGMAEQITLDDGDGLVMRWSSLDEAAGAIAMAATATASERACAVWWLAECDREKVAYPEAHD